MSWHATAGMIDRYLTDTMTPTDVMSIEAHLPECSRCQEMMTRRVDRRRLAASWLEIERRLTAPVPHDTREIPMTSDQPARDHEPSHDSDATEPVRRSRRRRPQLLIAASFLVTMLIVLAAVVLSSEDDPPIAEPDSTVTTEAAVAPTTSTPTAPSTTEATVTSTTLPPPPPIDMVWAQVGSQDAFGHADAIWKIIEGGPGLLAVGSTDGGGGYTDAAVWTSPDGETWERVGDPEVFRGVEDPVVGTDRNQVIMNITAGPGGYAAVGWVDRRAGDLDPPIWFSPDGTTWQRVTAAGPDGSDVDFAIVVADDAGYLAVGTQVWRSADGLNWQRAATGAFDDIDECIVSCNLMPPHIASRGDTRAIVVNGAGDGGGSGPLGPLGLGLPEIWITQDDETWTRARLSEEPAFATAIAIVDGLFVVSGYDEEGAALWTSEDGSVWTRLASLAGSNRGIFPGPLVIDDSIWIVPAIDVLGPPTTGNAVGSAVVFASEDNGARWQQVYVESASPEGVYLEGIDARPAGIRDLIRFGDRFVAVGSTGNGSTPIWIGTWE